MTIRHTASNEGVCSIYYFKIGRQKEKKRSGILYFPKSFFFFLNDGNKIVVVMCYVSVVFHIICESR